jgi:hypothetical protein
MPSRPLRHSGPETGHQPLAVERDFQCDLKLLFFLRYSIVCLISAPHRYRHGYLRCRNETDPTKTPEREAILAALAEAPRRGAAGARVGNRLSPLPPTSGRRFEVNPRRIALDALFARIYVIRVSLKCPAERSKLAKTRGSRRYHLFDFIHSLSAAFTRCRRINPWLASKRLFWAPPGRAGGAVVEATVDHTLMRGSEPHDR